MTDQQQPYPQHAQPAYHPGPDFVAPPMAVDQFPAEPTPAPKWTCETPPSAFLLSLNGFDEIAIAANFGARIHDLREDPITGGRALVFVHQRRIGLKDPDAYNACMALSMQEVMDYFHPEPKPDDASAEGNAQGAYL